MRTRPDEWTNAINVYEVFMRNWIKWIGKFIISGSACVHAGLVSVNSHLIRSGHLLVHQTLSLTESIHIRLFLLTPLILGTNGSEAALAGDAQPATRAIPKFFRFEETTQKGRVEPSLHRRRFQLDLDMPWSLQPHTRFCRFPECWTFEMFFST